MGRYYEGTREDRRRREIRILSERLARHERNADAHPEHSSVGRMARHAADAVREKLQELGQARTRTAYLRG
jgi:hypothetical protein